jgi:D-aspartate ligase
MIGRNRLGARPGRVKETLACVMGSMDLVRPLGLAGIRSIVVARPGAPSLYSRFTTHSLCRAEFPPGDLDLVAALTRLGAAQDERPVLFYEEDAQLLLVSRHRQRLAQAFRFVIADARLVEDLVDKSRFAALAERLALPVPATRMLDPAADAPTGLDLRFPLIIKPLMRHAAWDRAADFHKVLRAETQEDIDALWPRLQALGAPLLAQEFIAGPETRIESYHCYVDYRGSIAAEFTGRKIRTYPLTCGHSTALEISDAADVRVQGRAAVEKLGLRGVAKFDFKRDRHSRLHLLEINPRFNLWHHLGAVAGMNLPAMVHADLTGSRRPQIAAARPGARWCSPWKDISAARADGLAVRHWLPWMLGCEAKSALAFDDPMPFVRSALHRAMPRRHGDTAGLQLEKQAG